MTRYYTVGINNQNHNLFKEHLQKCRSSVCCHYCSRERWWKEWHWGRSHRSSSLRSSLWKQQHTVRPQCQTSSVHANINANCLLANWQLKCLLPSPADSKLIILQNIFSCPSCSFVHFLFSAFLSFFFPSSSSFCIHPPSLPHRFHILLYSPLWPAFEKREEEIK